MDADLVQFDLGGFDVELGGWSAEVLPGLGTSDCCLDHGTPGCSDAQCQTFICGMDSYCCRVEWDLLCASLADSEPLCASNCIDPSANPSLGNVTSLQMDGTYPAESFFDVFLRIQTAAHGVLHNPVAIHVEAAAPIRNTPVDAGTNYAYGGAPLPVHDELDTPVGEISNVVHTPQAPWDCQPPPAAGDHCLASWLRLELTLPSCPMEELWLPGQVRMLRDDPQAGAGLGQDVIDAVLAKAEFAGTATCSGPLTVRLSATAASTGTVASLTPDEFFPADASFDVHLAVETGGETQTAGPAPMTTSVNALPPAAGEVYLGPPTALELLDGGGANAGEILPVAHGIGAAIACPADSSSVIRFTGPTHADFSVGIPGGGGGVDYDVVRCDLSALHAGGGSFAGLTCLLADVGATITDNDTPASGDGFYYVSRDGLGALNGTWNGGGASQQADRDTLLPSCP